ncbi:LytTR family transcriptional regulator DNA-binding domain-containing protein [Faecalimonas umbilicata]|nr:LytTR family transcriptional regulator DNA-binding domain-containing protein [Faecalimonas umbilicata]
MAYIQIESKKNWLVNPAHVQKIQRYSITLLQNIQIPVGKSRYEEVKEKLAKRKR